MLRRKGFEHTLMTSPSDGLVTAWDCLNNAFNRYANKQCMGTRTYLGEHKVAADKPALKKFGETTWMTYRQIGDRAKAFGHGLKALQVESSSALSVEEFESSHGALHCGELILRFYSL